MFEFTTLLILGGVGLFLFLTFFIMSALRRVVPTNEVHIVQSAKETKSYGKDTGHGNTYYEVPSSIPFFGVTKVVMPVSNFDVDLKGYEAYDKGRLPFVVDVKAFFRIHDSNVAAQRVANFEELLNQLTAIVQGAIRTILASSDIEEIMQGRSKFGDEFTQEVNGQLANWGVETVKNIELMDIRDGKDSKVIHNIMDKKKSHIEMESRTEVARNMKSAEMAEIEAQKEIDLQSQSAQQEVGLRTVEAKLKVEQAEEGKKQLITEQSKVTTEKELEVQKIKALRVAEINKETAKVNADKIKEVALIEANQNKEVALLLANQQKEAGLIKAEQDFQVQTKRAEAEALATTKKAEADLTVKLNNAKGLEAEGNAKATAEAAFLMAPVSAQIAQAKEIGGNKEYQNYLITIEQIKAQQEVGKAQAKALENADVKVITNTSSPTQGLNGVMDLFSSKGGTEVGAMLEGLKQIPEGKKLLDKFLGDDKKVQ